MTQEKSIKIYNHLSDSDKKQWYSFMQVHKAWYNYFMYPESVRIIDTNKKVRKKNMLTYSEEYDYFLKNGDGEYYGPKYECKIFYSYHDIKKIIDTEIFEDFDSPVLKKITSKTPLKDYRSNLHDKISLNDKGEIIPIVFYGDKKDAIVYSNRSYMFRIYYGLFHNKSFIDRMFCLEYDITQIDVDGLIFLHSFKFFTLTEWMSFGRAKNKFGSSARDFFKWYEDNGFIKRVEYKKSSMYKKDTKYRVKKMPLYTITDRGESMANDYMDCVLYKKKVSYDGMSKSGISPVPSDKKARVNRRRYPVQYLVYETMFQWVNYCSEVKFSDDDTIKQCKKMSSSDFYMNPYVFALAETHLLKSNGDKSNKKYIKSFMEDSRWGIDV